MTVLATRIQRCADLLAALVAVDTANPMGRSVTRTQPVERPAILAIERLLAPHADRLMLTRQTCSPLHESLIVAWPGDSSRRPALFESHLDTVPADAWKDRAWTPRIQGDRLCGLGACDDKGSLTAMLVALLELLESGAEPPRPIVLLCAGDEEYAQTGIHAYLREAAVAPAYGVFGEPTSLLPVIQHKGTVRWDVTVRGRSAHTSRPELGINAIHGMMDVMAELRLVQELLQARCDNPLLTGPTITVTQIHGGRTRNATPDECTIAVDFRVVPGMNPADERDAVIERLTSLPWEISHSPVQLLTPPLDTAPDSPLSRRAVEVCRAVIGEDVQPQGAPYGTDAAWAGRLCPAIVLGPGDIRYAHAVDEEVSLREVADAAEIYQRLMLEAFDEFP